MTKQALLQGYWDGITGLVTEPLQGAKKEVCICSFLVSVH